MLYLDPFRGRVYILSIRIYCVLIIAIVFCIATCDDLYARVYTMPRV